VAASARRRVAEFSSLDVKYAAREAAVLYNLADEPELKVAKGFRMFASS
jgi:hypothetical protein